MSDNRFNHLMTMHMHKHLTEAMDMQSIANQFVEKNDARLKTFGKFITE